ncbi:MAG: translation initiation factor IF-2 N-terminal domain-containing protein, partial [Acidimicrobiales bacterium]
MAARIRLYELARELGLSNKETLDLCVALGIGVKSHSSSIEDAQADRVRRKADREGLRRASQPEEPKPEAAGDTGAPPEIAGRPLVDSRRPVTSGAPRGDHGDQSGRPAASRPLVPSGPPPAPPRPLVSTPSAAASAGPAPTPTPTP